jgi:hypothetical protein
MKRDWNADELAEHWTLLSCEKPLLANKIGPTRLGFAVLLKFFQHEGCFPQHPQEVPDVVVRHVARQVDVEASAWAHYRWQGRTIEYHRAQIRKLLGFREATVEDGTALTAWLIEHVLPHDQQPDHLQNQILERCRALHIEPPSPERTGRLVRSALHTFETRFCAATCNRLSPQVRERLEALLLPEPSAASDLREPPEPGWAVLTGFSAPRSRPGRSEPGWVDSRDTAPSTPGPSALDGPDAPSAP